MDFIVAFRLALSSEQEAGWRGLMAKGRAVRFYIDPETDQPHIFKHDVTEDEVLEVLADPGEDRKGR
ncbi:hypothetical protein MASR1M12_45080 [Erysipelotrichia bacterium]